MQSKDLVSRLEKCYTGAVYDVLREKGIKNTILPHEIKSIDPSKKIAGRIWTCSGEIDESLDMSKIPDGKANRENLYPNVEGKYMFLVAIKDIKTGQELTANYNLYTYPKTGVGIQSF